MPSIDTKLFFTRIACKDEAVIRITGIQNGNFILMADYESQTYIHSKSDGKHIEYKDIQDIFRLIQLECLKTDIVVSLKNWESR